jgi:hypothetical protein
MQGKEAGKQSNQITCLWGFVDENVNLIDLSF